ncbi:hypothetical protein J1N35_005489 [Gossypium stocksii]|uniref:Uncharacterized protein n=1 Tax=Gossypium stocksii TaxID=47602 RepID=A0A9D4AIN0_9ROSI|nr:hypothetical protein J1N35_005489 [Gossypium stocksii]
MPEIFVTCLKSLIKAQRSTRMKELMMSYHFFDNINGLKALGKSWPNKDMVKKMLNSLPKSWE